MSTPHLLNILVHILAGGAAILLGLYLLAAPQATPLHRRRGRVFVALTLGVCSTAVIGNIFFRFMPLFALLTIIVSCQLLSGWHVIYTKAAGPNTVDALLLLCAATATAVVLPQLSGASAGAAGSVVTATLGGLVAVLVYEAARWLFPRRWHASLWRYEHIYKLVASLFAMLSAAIGNTIEAGQPWSQLAPIGVGLPVILWFWARNHRQQRRLAQPSALPGASPGQIG